MAAAEKERLRRWQEHDFYGVLGVAASASAADVKRGFRKVALTCHPDKVPAEERAQATKRFQLIAEAYEVLSSPHTRGKYDALRRAPAGRPPPAAAGPPASRRPPPARPPEAPAAPRPSAGTSGSGTGAWRGVSCEGCLTRCQPDAMKKCPSCGKSICTRCRTCAACPASRPPQPAAPPASRAPPPQAAGPASRGPQQAARPAAGRRAAPVWAAAGQRGGEEVWTRAGPAAEEDAGVEEEQEQEEDAEEALDVLGILLAMGFEEEEARSAAGRAGSVEDAVELLMMGPVGAAGQAVLGVADQVGVKDLVQDVGYGVGGLVQALGQRISSWAPFMSTGGEAELAAQLVAMGYTEDEADAASRRCSSVEAAVEWISAHPVSGR